MSTSDATPTPSVGLPDRSTEVRMPRRSVIGAVLVVFLVSVVLPFVFLPLTERVTGTHTAFHVIGILVCAVGIVVQRRLRRDASRTVKVMSWIVTVCMAAWLVGHAGELVTVFADGGVAHDGDTFAHPLHMFFASIAVPAWMLTVVSSVALLTALAVHAARRRRRL